MPRTQGEAYAKYIQASQAYYGVKFTAENLSLRLCELEHKVEDLELMLLALGPHSPGTADISIASIRTGIAYCRDREAAVIGLLDQAWQAIALGNTQYQAFRYDAAYSSYEAAIGHLAAATTQQDMLRETLESKEVEATNLYQLLMELLDENNIQWEPPTHPNCEAIAIPEPPAPPGPNPNPPPPGPPMATPVASSTNQPKHRKPD